MAEPVAGNWQNFDSGGAAWDGLSGNQPLPLQQSWGYGEAMRKFGAQPLRLVCCNDRKVIASAQLMRNRLLRFFKPAMCFRGPLWTDSAAAPDMAARSENLTGLRAMFSRRRLEFLLVMPEQETSPEAHGMMRGAGFRRVMTGYSTIWLDLAADAETLRSNLDPKWRNKVVRAERGTLEISVGGKRAHQYAWLLEREDAQREAVRYVGLPTGLVEHFAGASGEVGERAVVSLTAINDRDKVAGALFLLHGNSATYFTGWNGAEGRALAAHNLLLWRAMMELKDCGIRWLDLGGLNTTHGAGIARFKLGMGARPLTLAGTYL